MASTDLERLILSVEANTVQIETQLKKLTSTVDGSFKAIEDRANSMVTRVEAAFNDVGLSFAKYFAAGYIVGQVEEFTRSVITSTAALGDQAATVGVTVEQLQAYRAAAAEAGSSTAIADASLQRLTRSIGQAQDGNTALVKTFSELGISANLLAGGTTSVLPLIAQALLNIADTTERARIETQIFGKSGQEVESLLHAWSASADSLEEHFSKLGVIIDAATAEKFSHAQGQFELFTLQMQKGLVDIIAGLGDLATAEGRTKLFTDGYASGQQQARQLLGGPGLQPSITVKEGQITGIPNFIRPGLDQAPDINVTTKQRGDLEDAAARAGVNNIAGFDDDTLKALTQFHTEATAAWGKYYEGITKLADENVTRIQDIQDAAGQRELARGADLRQSIKDGLNEQFDAQANLTKEIQQVEDDADAQAAEMRQRSIDQFNQRISSNVANSIANLGDTMQQSGAKFGKVVEQMALDLVKLIVKLELTKTIESSLGGGGGGILGLLGGLFGGGGGNTGGGLDIGDIPGRAVGGPVSAGTPYKVGEHGEELFVPTVPGRIIPRGAGPGGSTQININVSLDGANGDQAITRMAHAAVITAVTQVKQQFPSLLADAQMRFF